MNRAEITEFVRRVELNHEKRWLFFILGLIVSGLLVAGTYCLYSIYSVQVTSVYLNAQLNPQLGDMIQRLSVRLGFFLGFGLAMAAFLMLWSVSLLASGKRDELLVRLARQGLEFHGSVGVKPSQEITDARIENR